MTLQEEIFEEFHKKFGTLRDDSIPAGIDVVNNEIETFIFQALRRQAEAIIKDVYPNAKMIHPENGKFKEINVKEYLRSKYLLPLIEKHD